MKKILLSLGLSLLLATNGFCAWDKTKPADSEKLKDTPALIRANWTALETGTDANLLITNAKVSPTAGIVDTKLAQITTASKVSVTAITGTLGIGNGGTGLTSAGGTANRLLGTSNGSTFGLLQVDLASAMITGALPIANGGTGLSSAGGSANRVMLTTDGSAWSAGQVNLTSMVTGTLPVGNLPVGSASGICGLDAGTKVATASLGSGTANSTTVLYGDQTYKTIPTTWANIAGDGAILFASADTEQSKQYDETYTKVKEFTMTQAGAYKVSWKTSTNTSGANVKVYKNGVAVSSAFPHSGGYSTADTYTITGIVAGDLIQLYYASPNNASIAIKEARLYGGFGGTASQN
jgi:hypothetical protein